MNYLEMLEYLYNERPSGKITLGLDRIKQLCEALQNPQDSFLSVHITGTNGKGSVTRFLSHLFLEHGMKTGSYYSPHLSSFRERILVDEQFVPEQDMLKAFDQVQKIALQMDQKGEQFRPSFFEFTTAMAFLIYKEMKVQAGSIEVGLGGRFDATNVLIPQVSVIVTVDYDHMQILGDSLEKIAFEKAGIIKQRVPVVCGETKTEPLHVIKKISELNKSDLHLFERDFYYDNQKLQLSDNHFDFHGKREYKDLSISLNGEHQFLNASVALEAFLIFAERTGLQVDETAIRRALNKARMPGRFEVLNTKPRVIFDGAHNRPAAKVLRKTVVDYLSGEKLAAVIGIVDDKDKEGVLSQIAPLFEKIIVTRPFSHRAQNPQQTFEIAKQFNQNVEFENDPIKAYERLKEDGYETIIITGSLYLVGYLRDYITDGRLEPEWSIVR
ncbi:MAG TPA: folylpolyglutamate synthase/dihydrofolate synthase family protein [Pseudothermotoga sp.]|nr:folylpolyglutamate synthase/dihydrofolate synthase family protein [Pseudothermotoga sp.]HOK83307.1 folylpolyglutamate synthase/dihydrofolate synthase family protein [Pseudothermotoga sp.]HPP70132.1 folylpolyglutamate synthase/dihydrofolate synthase family protein [Pseudothermotoga sp.]